MTTNNTKLIVKGEAKDGTAPQDKQITNVKDLHTERIDIVSELLLSNYSRMQIIQHCNTVLMWNLSPRQIDNYISDARQAQRTYYKSSLPTLLEDTAADYDMLYKKAVAAKDYRGAAKIKQMKYEMIAGKPIQETRELAKQDQPSITIMQVINGKEQAISLKVNKKTDALPEPDKVD